MTSEKMPLSEKDRRIAYGILKHLRSQLDNGAVQGDPAESVEGKYHTAVQCHNSFAVRLLTFEYQLTHNGILGPGNSLSLGTIAVLLCALLEVCLVHSYLNGLVFSGNPVFV